MSVRAGTVSYSFLLARAFRYDGKLFACSVPPANSATPDPQLCPGWPKSLVLSKTVVRVRYWVGPDQSGVKTNIAIEIDGP